MLMTVTNVSGRIINTPITGGSGVSPDAVGGSVSDPLPYPFSHVGPVAIGGSTAALPVHEQDWRFKSVPWLPSEPADDWNYLVQAKVVTIGFGAEVAPPVGQGDQEDRFVNAV